MRRGAALPATLALLLASACASDRYYDRERNNPAYYNSGAALGVASIQPGGGAPGVPQSSPPGTYGAAYNVAQDSSTASIFGAVAGVALATRPDYYRDSAIRGQCMLRTKKDDPFEMPCMNALVALTDLEGKELARAQTNMQGNFGFFVKKGEKYRVRPVSEKFLVDPERAGPLVMGDQLLLHLLIKEGGK